MERLANALGKKQPSISSIVNGNPKLSNLQDIARVMGISISELLADSDNEESKLICPKCGYHIKLKAE